MRKRLQKVAKNTKHIKILLLAQNCPQNSRDRRMTNRTHYSKTREPPVWPRPAPRPEKILTPFCIPVFILVIVLQNCMEGQIWHGMTRCKGTNKLDCFLS